MVALHGVLKRLVASCSHLEGSLEPPLEPPGVVRGGVLGRSRRRLWPFRRDETRASYKNGRLASTKLSPRPLFGHFLVRHLFSFLLKWPFRRDETRASYTKRAPRLNTYRRADAAREGPVLARQGVDWMAADGWELGLRHPGPAWQSVIECAMCKAPTLTTSRVECAQHPRANQILYSLENTPFCSPS